MHYMPTDPRQIHADKYAPKIPPPSQEFLSSRGASSYSRSTGALTSMPDVKWSSDFKLFCYGTVTPVCISAWVMFIGIPLLFYVYVRFAPHPWHEAIATRSFFP